MTTINDISIDSDISPAEAGEVMERLKDFASSTQAGTLGITPAPSLLNLPTQTALQLLFSAMREIGGSRDVRDFVHPETLDFCTEILGKNWHAEMIGTDNMGEEND